MTGEKVLQIRIELMGAESSIWRRILIDERCTFWDLHVAIQDAMGWTDSHLHAFRVTETATGEMRYIGLPMDEDGMEIDPGWEHEEVGGVFGYEQLLEAIADPEHEEHLEWMGGAFDPDGFDAGSVEFQDPEQRRWEVMGDVVAAWVPVVAGPWK